MLKILDLKQLGGLSTTELSGILSSVKGRLKELDELKAKKGSLTKSEQEELDLLTVYSFDVHDCLLEKKEHSDGKNPDNETTSKEDSESKYVPEPGTENMIHLEIVRGRRFNPNTGKRESVPYVQIFSFSEWTAFKSAHKGLGYVITKVLHDPYGDAEKYVEHKD